ncbi:hypothetical protein HC928_19445 [bacterium]|nr:hypothetical protein [bacterium]
MGIFAREILDLRSRNTFYSEPKSFKAYVDAMDATADVKLKKTPEYLSPQSLETLDKELREQGYMVFRLGLGDRKTTFFALAKLQQDGNWSEYFLLDREIFEDVPSEIFIPNVSVRQLFAFNLLARLTENSLINLAISSGLLSTALGIESSESLAAPASGHGTFTFEFKAAPEAPTWTHQNGQVEIDALFVGKHEQRETLFVIEAKTSDKFESLAKQKLVYPVLALSEKIPGYIPIIPVYVRAIKPKQSREINFYIAKCQPLNPREKTISISDLKVIAVKNLVLMGFNEHGVES